MVDEPQRLAWAGPSLRRLKTIEAIVNPDLVFLMHLNLAARCAAAIIDSLSGDIELFDVRVAQANNRGTYESTAAATSPKLRFGSLYSCLCPFPRG